MFDKIKEAIEKYNKIKNEAIKFRDSRYVDNLKRKSIVPAERIRQGEDMKKWLEDFKKDGNIVVKDVDAFVKELLNYQYDAGYKYIGTDGTLYYYLRFFMIKKKSSDNRKTLFVERKPISIVELIKKYDPDYEPEKPKPVRKTKEEELEELDKKLLGKGIKIIAEMKESGYDDVWILIELWHYGADITDSSYTQLKKMFKEKVPNYILKDKNVAYKHIKNLCETFYTLRSFYEFNNYDEAYSFAKKIYAINLVENKEFKTYEEALNFIEENVEPIYQKDIDNK